MFFKFDFFKFEIHSKTPHSIKIGFQYLECSSQLAMNCILEQSRKQFAIFFFTMHRGLAIQGWDLFDEMSSLLKDSDVILSCLWDPCRSTFSMLMNTYWSITINVRQHLQPFICNVTSSYEWKYLQRDKRSLYNNNTKICSPWISLSFYKNEVTEPQIW